MKKVIKEEKKHTNFKLASIFNQWLKYHFGILHDDHKNHHDIRMLWISLLREEFQEYLEGEWWGDLKNIAKELIDMLYIIYGTCFIYGIPADHVFKEIHRANMTKCMNNQSIQLGIKCKKGTFYKAPNIDHLINNKYLKIDKIKINDEK